MMWMVSVCTVVVLLAMVVERTEAATAIGLATINKDYPDQCIDEDTGKPHGLESSWAMKGVCGAKTCYKRGNTLYVDYQTCGYTQASPPCYTVEKMSLEYPACCPRVVCEQDSYNEIDTEEYRDYTALASDAEDELYMMSSYDAPVSFYDTAAGSFYDMDGDLLATSSEVHETEEEDYMIDWDTLFAQK